MPLFAIAHALHLHGGGYAIRCPELPGCEGRSLKLPFAREQFGAALSQRVIEMIAAGELPPLYSFDELEACFAAHCRAPLAAPDRLPGTFDTVIAVRPKLPPEAVERLMAMRMQAANGRSLGPDASHTASVNGSGPAAADQTATAGSTPADGEPSGTAPVGADPESTVIDPPSATGAPLTAEQSIEQVIAEMAGAARPKREVRIVPAPTPLAVAMAERLAVILKLRPENTDQAPSRVDALAKRAVRTADDANGRLHPPSASMVAQPTAGPDLRPDAHGEDVAAPAQPAARPAENLEQAVAAKPAEPQMDQTSRQAAGEDDRTALGENGVKQPYTIRSAIDDIVSGLKGRPRPMGSDIVRVPARPVPRTGNGAGESPTPAALSSNGGSPPRSAGAPEFSGDTAPEGPYTIESAIDEIERSLMRRPDAANDAGSQDGHPAPLVTDSVASERSSESRARPQQQAGHPVNGDGPSRVDPREPSGGRLDPSARLARIAAQLAGRDPDRLARLRKGRPPPEKDH